MKKQIIATGISGLVGSRVKELLGKQYEFINFSLDKGVDITNFSLLKTKINQYPESSIILHLAAFTDVDSAFNQNENKNGSCYQVNVIGSKNIAQLCKKTNKYLINISTDFVFDGKNPPIGGYTENDEPNPIEWYGKTKYLAEEEIRKSGCQYSILRIAFPFKAKLSPKKLEPYPKLDLVRKIISKLKNREQLNMFTDQKITPTFIDDIAKVIDRVIELQPKGIFHSTGSTALSPFELMMKVAKVFNLDHSKVEKITLGEFLRQNPTSRPRPKNTSLSNKKLTQELGTKMSTIDEALIKCKKQLEVS